MARTMIPCLLGPRHGHLMFERDRGAVLKLSGIEANETHFYWPEDFMLNDGVTRRRFYYFIGTKRDGMVTKIGPPQEVREKAVDDYVLMERKGKAGATWENRWQEPEKFPSWRLVENSEHDSPLLPEHDKRSKVD